MPRGYTMPPEYDDPLGLAGDAETAQAAYRANPPYLGPRAVDAEMAQAQYRAEGPRVTFVPLGTPDSIGPGTVTVAQPDPMPDALSDPLGLGPRFAPSPIPGVTSPAPQTGLPFGQRFLRGLEGLSAGIQGRVPAFERRDKEAKAEARQTEADRLTKLKLLAELADKTATTPELADFYGRLGQQIAGKDFDPEEWATLTSGKGLALDAADFAEEMGEEYAGRFVQTVRPIRKDPTKVETVRKAFVADAKAKALDRLKPELLRRLRLPEVRAELLNAGDGKAITEAALLADLTGEGSGLKRFEREALTEWVQSTEGRQQLLQIGVTPGSLTMKAEEAAATREPKVMDFGDALESAAREYGLEKYEKAMRYADFTSSADLAEIKRRANEAKAQQAAREKDILLSTQRDAAQITPYKPQDLNDIVHAETLARAPIGLTPARAEAEGYVAVDEGTKRRITAVQETEGTLTTIEQLSQSLFNAPNAAASVAQQAYYATGGGRLDPNYMAYRDAKGLLGTRVARIIGQEVGNLSQQEQEAARNAIPNERDTRQSKAIKLATLRAIQAIATESVKASMTTGVLDRDRAGGLFRQALQTMERQLSALDKRKAVTGPAREVPE